MKKPLVDITTFNGIESLFSGRKKDPWAYDLAGRFADAFIYSENIRYAKPLLTQHEKTPSVPHEPSLLIELERRENNFFKSEVYSSKTPRLLEEAYLEEAFGKFRDWAKNNPNTIRSWISLHNEDWIRRRRPLQNEGLIFSLHDLEKELPFLALSQEIVADPHELCHVFDVILRNPIYGELAGEDEYYLNHPLRDAFLLPTMEAKEVPSPQIAISFEESIINFLKNYNVNKEEYSILLHEIRGNIWDQGINNLGPGQVDKEVLRDIAEKVKLPPRIKDVGKLTITAAGILTTAGTVIGAAPAVALVGTLISVSSLIWKGYLPRSTTRIKWLRWALKYDLDNQARNSQ